MNIHIIHQRERKMLTWKLNAMFEKKMKGKKRSEVYTEVKKK